MSQDAPRVGAVPYSSEMFPDEWMHHVARYALSESPHDAPQPEGRPGGTEQRGGVTRLRMALALLLAAGTIGCLPLPIPNTVLVTPAVKGRLVTGDGRPVSGAPVALVGRGSDNACAEPSARAVTDTEGRFSFAEVEEKRSILWLTLMENFGMVSYHVCAGDPGDTVTNARADVSGSEIGDQLACINWMFEGAPHVSCNSTTDLRSRTGGGWSTDSARGFFRLIVERTDTSPGVGETYLQWIEQEFEGAPATVRATIHLSLGRKVWFDELPTFGHDEGRWFIAGEARSTAGWGWHRVLRLELGGPGVVEQLPSPDA